MAMRRSPGTIQIDSRSGVTMAELCIAIAAMGLLVLALPRFFSQLNKSFMAASTNSSSQENARVGTQEILRLLTIARSSTVTLTQQSGEDPYSEIDYTNTSNVPMAIYQKNSNLIHLANGVEHVLLKKSLVRLVFAYPDLSDPNLIQVTVTVKDSLGTNKSRTMGTVPKKIHLENQ
jgi:Tfp pilus assembly protein FimT